MWGGKKKNFQPINDGLNKNTKSFELVTPEKKYETLQQVVVSQITKARLYCIHKERTDSTSDQE